MECSPAHSTMTGTIPRIDVDAVLASLKDFQRQTVEHVFGRMYTDPEPTHRFLVADEVGLGKTLVARGVIARTIDHLWDRVGRMDVVYICSNGDIARQNVNRLNVTRQQEFALASRLTMLPVMLHNLKGRRLNFVSFTPGTSFELKTSLGRSSERALLYHLLDATWGLRGAGPKNVLQGSAGAERFRRLVKDFRRDNRIDEDLKAAFGAALERRCREDREAGSEDLRSRFDELCRRFAWLRTRIPKEDARLRSSFVGELRALLAATCIRALEPDLIILDEFQRFKSLMDGQDEASQLAHELFTYGDEHSKVRILLLSATPYKMYTTADEEGDDDHYVDLVRTVAFLHQDPVATQRVEALLRDYRRHLRHLASGGGEALRETKVALEAELRKIMVRTERLAVSGDRNGMLTEIDSRLTLDARDVLGFRGVQRIADEIERADMIEYWKAAPYLLSFMDEYEFKREFKLALENPETAKSLLAIIREHPELLLPPDIVSASPPIDPPNSRMRWLMQQTVDAGMWGLLWMPPSCPYYQLAGAYAEAFDAGITKRLIFSAWRVVPKVIATLLSYEAERRMIRGFSDEQASVTDIRERIVPLLRFSRSEGRLTGMPLLTLLYPSVVLMWAGDPLKLDLPVSEQPPTLDEVLKLVERRIGSLLKPVVARAAQSGPPDEAWYWAAPVLLDLQHAPDRTRNWFGRADLAQRWAAQVSKDDADEGDSLWAAHVDRVRDLLAGTLKLGPPPPDLARILALNSVASPAVCALRAFSRVAGEDDASIDQEVRDGAGQLAWAFRNLFNLPEVIALVRSTNRDEPYWLRVLEHCAAGGLQAVLDEYAHVLRESLGLLDASHAEIAAGISAEMRDALSLRTATLAVDDLLTNEEGGPELRSHRMRARFAVRFGAEEDEERGKRSRADLVRAAFNSPFWPFVLASTTVGQEGLDFHQYCHAVVHWNLPSNPVDLEQREGRVHRYKGHAVRKNLVLNHRESALAAEQGDPWARLFDAAGKARSNGSSDVVPYWIYPVEGGARIQRYVPALPLSRDVARLQTLRRALVTYRMVFGQPRQDELLDFLLAHMADGTEDRTAAELRIDLSPNR